MNKKTVSLFRNGIYNYIQTFMKLAFPVITFAYVSRILGETGIGKINFTKSVMSLFTMVAMLGIDQYATREAAKLRDDSEALRCFVREMLFINACTTLVAYLLFALAVRTVPKLNENGLLMCIYSPLIIMRMMGMEWLYRALEEFHFPAIATTVLQAVSFGAMLLLVRDANDVIPYAAINLISTYGAYVAMFFYAHRLISLHQTTRARMNLRKHLKPIIWLSAIAFSIELYTGLDSALLGFLQDDAAVGRYTAAVRVDGTVNTLMYSLGYVMVSRLSYFRYKGNQVQMQGLVNNMYNYTFLLSVPSMIGLISLSNAIIRAFSGPQFASAAGTIRLLAPIVLVIPFSATTNQQVMVSIGKERYVLTSTVVGAVTNFIGDMFFIPRYAENGAVVATVIAETCVAIVCFYNVHRYFDMRKVFNKHYQYWIASLPIPLISYLFKCLCMPEALYIVLTMFFSATVYFSILLLMKNAYVMQAIRAAKKSLQKLN